MRIFIPYTVLFWFPFLSFASEEIENEMLSEDFLEFILEFEDTSDDDFELLIHHGTEDVTKSRSTSNVQPSSQKELKVNEDTEIDEVVK